MVKNVMTGIAVRFWGKVVKSDGCWLWVGVKNTSGYGIISLGRRDEGKVSAHRLSWELHYGPIPHGRHVLHRCDTPSCVNPGHLFIGTHQDNMKDMESKGRRGKTGPIKGAGAKSDLSKEQVVALKADYEIMSQQQLAAKYGIGQSTVSRILRGESCNNIG